MHQLSYRRAQGLPGLVVFLCDRLVQDDASPRVMLVGFCYPIQVILSRNPTVHLVTLLLRLPTWRFRTVPEVEVLQLQHGFYGFDYV